MYLNQSNNQKKKKNLCKIAVASRSYMGGGLQEITIITDEAYI